jgi:hypothetical protein
VPSQASSFEDKVVRLLEQNNNLQQRNLIAIKETRDAVNDTKRVLVDINDKLRKISLNY